MFYQQYLIFLVFVRYRVFQKKKLLKFLLLRFVRLRQEWQEEADVADFITIEYCPCFEKMYFPAILRVTGNKTFFLSQLCWSIVTNLRTYYQATHFLIYQKQFPFFCLLSFITSFVSLTVDSPDSFLDSLFASKNAIYNAIKKHTLHSNNFFCEIKK